MTAKVYLQRIKNAFNTIRHKYPDITDDMLLDNGAIYYHNTSKSTEDCYQEDRVLPPFEVCYAGGEPFISMRIHSDGSVKFHVNAITKSLPSINTHNRTLNISPSMLYRIMKAIADIPGRYNANIETLDWSIDLE